MLLIKCCWESGYDKHSITWHQSAVKKGRWLSAEIFIISPALCSIHAGTIL